MGDVDVFGEGAACGDGDEVDLLAVRRETDAVAARGVWEGVVAGGVVGAQGLRADEAVQAGREDSEVDFAVAWSREVGGVGGVGGGVAPVADGYGFHVECGCLRVLPGETNCTWLCKKL